MKFKEGGFTFEDTEDGYAVYKGRTYLRAIRAMKESNGRHCFVLEFDQRKKPATYRGMVTAAKALNAIAALKREAQRRGWETEEIILRAWDRRPLRIPGAE
jgi:hypothetical protein